MDWSKGPTTSQKEAAGKGKNRTGKGPGVQPGEPPPRRGRSSGRSWLARPPPSLPPPLLAQSVERDGPESEGSESDGEGEEGAASSRSGSSTRKAKRCPLSPGSAKAKRKRAKKQTSKKTIAAAKNANRGGSFPEPPKIGDGKPAALPRVGDSLDSVNDSKGKVMAYNERVQRRYMA